MTRREGNRNHSRLKVLAPKVAVRHPLDEITTDGVGLVRHEGYDHGAGITSVHHQEDAPVIEHP